MDYMGPGVRCSKKAVKLNHSLTVIDLMIIRSTRPMGNRVIYNFSFAEALSDIYSNIYFNVIYTTTSLRLRYKLTIIFFNIWWQNSANMMYHFSYQPAIKHPLLSDCMVYICDGTSFYKSNNDVHNCGGEQ